MEKYFGKHEIDQRVKGGCAVSVSFSLKDTSAQAESRLGGFYGKRFLSSHKETLRKLAVDHEILQSVDLEAINSFDELHEEVTSKLFNYASVEEFYEEASCINYIDGIKQPVYVLNAQNDPFLGSHCYPTAQIQNHPMLYAEYPKRGGHVGFAIVRDEFSYIEYAAEKFINEVILSPQT